MSGPINPQRRSQLMELMAARAWGSLLLYGNGWRKDYFRSLVNVNFSGPHAAARLSRSGDLTVVVAGPWDYELISAALDEKMDGKVIFQPDFASALGPASAIAGIELMETRFLEGAVSATAELEELRRVKTADELEHVKKAAELADRGYQLLVEAIAPGMKEYELVAEVEAFLKSNGAEDNFMLMASGGAEVTGMRPPTDRVLRQGDCITTELTPQVNGYYAQICRTLVLGDPSSAQIQAFSIFSEAQQAAQDLIKPGVNVSEAARVQNDVFRKYGYGEYTGPRYTRVRGHCLGLYPDETPHILEDSDYAIKEGMVLIAHPNTYLPLSGYMVLGDTLLVTSGGNISLNDTGKKLFVK